MEFENKFREEKTFLSGENLMEWNSSQFHYFLTSLQYLYFNGLAYTKYNKLCQPISFGYNSYTKHCIRCISTLRAFKEPAYTQPCQIEDFILSNYAFFENELHEIDKPEIKEVDIDNPFIPTAYSAIGINGLSISTSFISGLSISCSSFSKNA